MFQGFSEKTSEFMWELAFHNERPWFQEHKQEFEDCLNTPFKALAADTFALLCDRYPDITFYSHVSRIYRDARRLFGRGPYKEKLWFSFKTDTDDYDGPVFWFEIGAAEYSFGMGSWGSPAFMERFRKTVDANPAAFERIARDLERHPEYRIDNEEYKKPKGNYGPPISNWYSRKHIGLFCTKEFGGDLFLPELPRILVENYQNMMPLFRYLLDIYQSMEK